MFYTDENVPEERNSDDVKREGTIAALIPRVGKRYWDLQHK